MNVAKLAETQHLISSPGGFWQDGKSVPMNGCTTVVEQATRSLCFFFSLIKYTYSFLKDEKKIGAVYIILRSYQRRATHKFWKRNHKSCQRIFRQPIEEGALELRGLPGQAGSKREILPKLIQEVCAGVREANGCSMGKSTCSKEEVRKKRIL